MRGLAAAFAIAALFLAPACKRKHKQQKAESAAPAQSSPSQSAPAPLASNISMGDPAYAPQLLKGFHGVEASSWRWTQKDFAVALGAPAGSEKNGAKLVFRFSIPELVAQKLKSVTLSATINSVPLEPQQYSKSGFFTYSRDVPADRLKGGQAVVEFTLDKALEPGEVETRQLGVIASQVGLESK